MKLFNKKYIDESGFSLAEVMVAVGIISFVSLTLVNFDKIFKQGVKQGSGKLTQQKLASAIDKLIYSNLACSNTFTGLNPNVTNTSVKVNNLIDDVGSPILSINDEYGGVGADGTRESGRLVISDMYISHYGDSVSNPDTHFNRADEFSLTVELTRDDSGRVRTLIERFKVRAEVDGAGVITGCAGEPPINLNEVCDLFQGTFATDGPPSGTSEICRSLFVALRGGTDVRPGANNDNAITTELNTNVDVFGSTVLEGSFVLGSAGFNPLPGRFYVEAESRLRDDIMVGALSFHSGGIPLGTAGFPGALATGSNILYFANGLGINVSGIAVPANELSLTGSIRTGSAWIFNSPLLTDTAQNDYVTTVGTVREAMRLILSSDSAEATSVITDIVSSLPDVTNPVGDNATNYVCAVRSLLAERIRVRSSGTTSFISGSYPTPGGDCTLNALTDTNFLATNCQIDDGESVASNKIDCPEVHGATINLGGGVIDDWSLNEFAGP